MRKYLGRKIRTAVLVLPQIVDFASVKVQNTSSVLDSNTSRY
jgi:hypothetical protein